MSTMAVEQRNLLLGTFESLCASALALKNKRDEASKVGATSYLDAFNKSEDSQVKDIRTEYAQAVKHAQDLRDQAKARLVEINELTAEAAALDKYREDASTSRGQVRAMYDALVKSQLITDSDELASIEKWARPVLGQERGRKTETSEVESEQAEDEASTEDEAAE